MKKNLLIAGLAIGTLCAALGVVYAAVMMTPEATTMATAESTGAASTTQPIPSTDVPPPNPMSPLATDIPGCVCHSDDPKLVEQHATYRMNQCFGCHGEDVPTGQK